MIRKHVQGSVLLIALGITTVCLTLAFAFLRSVRAVLPGAGQDNMTRLARSTARMGANHAMAALMDTYCRSNNVPTHYRQASFAGFRPIDSGRVGWWTADVADNRPWGAEGTPEDANGNDVRAEDMLVEKYLVYKGRNINRVELYATGHMRCHPLARWIEPGNVAADLVNDPVSFHLRHPAAADVNSPDPAEKNGEPWTPPALQPGISYFDSELRPVSLRSEARFRLRYANTIEDLSGHVCITAPGLYVPPIRSPAGASPQTPQQVDDEGSREVDRTIAERWHPSLSAMVMSAPSAQSRWSLINLFRGLGMPGQSHDGDGPQNANGVMALAQVDAGVPKVMCDYDLGVGQADGVFDTLARPWSSFGTGWLRVGLSAGMRGPIRDFETLKTARWSNAELWTYDYSPYGRGSRQSNAPGAWDEAPTDCPWRLNVPTMTVQAIYDMVYGFLPEEARTYLYTEKSTETRNTANPTRPDGQINWNPPTVVSIPRTAPEAEIVQLGTGLRNAQPFQAMLTGRRPAPGDPYPGTTNAPPTGWRVDLGVMPGPTDRSVSMLQFNRGGPIVGLDAGYLRSGPESLTTVDVTGPVANHSRIVRRPGGANFLLLQPGNAYKNPGSYWWDIGVALLQTFGTAMYVWNDETGASHAGSPTAGQVFWPAGNPLASSPPAGPVRAIDRDADGDGINESPSLLDSVEEMDHLFISNMGEWWGDYPTGSRPSSVAMGLYVYLDRSDGFTSTDTAIPRIRRFDDGPNAVTGGNIKSMLSVGSITPLEASNMELVLNNTRLSFFGCSPQYYDAFRGIDFDDDGTVWCVGYQNGRCPADPTTGKGRVLDAGSGDQFVCLTGYVVFQQSHFYRVFTRGEVFDEFLGRSVAKADLETVMAIDPDGSLYDVRGHGRSPAWNANPAQCTGMDDSQIVYQRWTRTLNMRSGMSLPP